ncbi:Sensor-type histidine kinase prrB [Mycobacterium tuberculosis]|nr:Sensor-type histidine kinase prrB [Mycobacterium tuberculosis]
MDEKAILDRINEFIEEEHTLRQAHERAETSDAQALDRLRRLEVALDQCWDLLRQRRARRAAGQNPDEAEVRPAGEVEGYLQ